MTEAAKNPPNDVAAGAAKIAAAAGPYIEEAIATLGQLMRDQDVAGSVRLTAANSLLSRGGGRPGTVPAGEQASDSDLHAVLQAAENTLASRAQGYADDQLDARGLPKPGAVPARGLASGTDPVRS